MENNSNETQHCWFCGNPISNDDYNWVLPMYKEVSRDGSLTTSEVRFKQIDVSIPRCNNCQQEQKKGSTLTTIVWITVIVAAIVIILVTQSDLWWLIALIAVAIIAVFSMIQGKIADNKAKQKGINHDITAHPTVKALLEDGWGFAEPQAH